MSVQSEIDRLRNNVSQTLGTIAATGVEVGEGADAMPAAAAALANEKQDKITASGILKGNGSSVSAAVPGTDYTTPANVSTQIQNLIGRTNAVNQANTNYTTLMARGIKVVSSDTSPGVNGAISFTYST